MRPTTLTKLAGAVAGATLPARSTVLPNGRTRTYPTMALAADVLLLSDDLADNGFRQVVTIQIDDLLGALYGGSVPAGPVTYAKLVNGDPDGAKGLKTHFDRWKADGLIT